MIQKIHQFLRSIEKVQSLTGRGSVDHDEIEAFVIGQLVELFGSHVFLAP